MNSLFWLASLPSWYEGFKELLQITSFYAKSQVVEVHTHEKKTKMSHSPKESLTSWKLMQDLFKCNRIKVERNFKRIKTPPIRGSGLGDKHKMVVLLSLFWILQNFFSINLI
jgi:hypothetical protein